MSDRDALLNESRRLSGMLIHLAEQAKADFAEAVAPFGLPVHLARAILMLEAPAPMYQLADSLACDRSYITGLADKLEERGLVARVTGEDRRVKLLELTESGAKLRREVSDAVAERSMVLSRLTASERQALEPLLLQLLGGIDPSDVSC
ncbi:MAG TPA: MarR family transcriptional regulator [Propionicimonas sp.]|jgi:DNA-binding MarR family transcriptional regulator|uniref:MarR family winged helix-turn-helix transcriptional regulator n=1 Tax=Propionicimonas sp. TaxID=1955623 RepID=UPI002F3E9C0F